MNWFDICLLAIIFISFVSGLRTGLARVLFHLVAVGAGLILALWCYGVVANSLMTFIHQPLAAHIAGFCLIFFGVMIAGSLLGWVVARFFRGIGLAWLDHLLGGAAGLIRGALLVAISVALVLAFTPLPAPEFINQSRVLPYATSVSAAIVQMAPLQIREGFAQQLDKLKQLWGRPASKDQRTA
jgi:membrane protein required for colicin V production